MADGEHPEDPESEDGKRKRTEGNKRKTVAEEEESMLRKTVKHLKTLGENRGEEGIRHRWRHRERCLHALQVCAKRVENKPRTK